MGAERIEEAAPSRECRSCRLLFPCTREYFSNKGHDRLGYHCTACRARKHLPPYARDITTEFLLTGDLTPYLIPHGTCLRWRGHSGEQPPRFLRNKHIIRTLWEREHGPLPVHRQLARTADCPHAWCVNSAHRRMVLGDQGWAPIDIASKPEHFRHLLEAVGTACEIPPMAILERNRDPTIVRARWVVITVLVAQRHTIMAIARLFERDHSTILHAYHRAQNDTDIARMSRAIEPHAGNIGMAAALQEVFVLLSPYQQAVAAFVSVDLLGEAPRTHHAGERLLGLQVLLGRPSLCTRISAILTAFERPGAAYLLDQFQRRYSHWALQAAAS